MKNKLIITSLSLLICLVSAYSQDYYWNKDEKVFVKRSNHENFYLFSNTDRTIEGLEIRSARVHNKTLHWALGNFEGDDSIEYVSPAVINLRGDTLNFSNLFYVRLKDEKNIEQLEKMAQEHGVEILGKNKFMPLWHTLSCNKNSTGNALEMANLFHESGLFSVAEVDFLMLYKLHGCPNININDTYFNNQWNLRNTGQYGGTPGIDINYCAARAITTGRPNVIVAVVDDGIQSNHPDLANVLPYGYDTQSGTNIPQVQIVRGHGTACAGIIGATSNNNIGISGIAPNVSLMSISHPFHIPYTNSIDMLATGINEAWRNGASVINCSWSSRQHSNLMNDAIDSALTRGRNGKGSVVVFTAGNNNASTVNYPASSHPDIIVVGAISHCGTRKSNTSCDGEWNSVEWGSNYGKQLDIMAPGVLIPTTDLTGNRGYNPAFPLHHMVGGNIIASDYADISYTAMFNGTSAAAPHVSAVAALILSVNPELTRLQVTNIIESTARKVGPYTYSNTPNRPNGTWNNEMGYGLLDAGAAVKTALCMLPSRSFSGTVNADTTLYGSSVTASNTTVQSGRKLTLVGCNSVTINSNFTVQQGASFEVRIAP